MAHLPRAAWPIVAGAVARAFAALRRPVLILVPAPERFTDELRPWLAGRPPVHVFAEIGISFLDRPPAFDDSVNKRLEALAAIARAGESPSWWWSPLDARSPGRPSRRATWSTEPWSWLQAADRTRWRWRCAWSSSGTRENHSSRTAASSRLRGGILDVFPAAADAPVRAEWEGDLIETLRLFDPENQRSVMAVPEASIRTGRELLLGPARGAAAVAAAA